MFKIESKVSNFFTMVEEIFENQSFNGQNWLIKGPFTDTDNQTMCNQDTFWQSEDIYQCYP